MAPLPPFVSPLDLSQGPARGMLGKVVEPTWVTSQFQPQDLTRLCKGSDPAFNKCWSAPFSVRGQGPRETVFLAGPGL